jgi:GcrA cell cycle regulator
MGRNPGLPRTSSGIATASCGCWEDSGLVLHLVRDRGLSMNWTDERVEMLKRLWGEGLSASQIARQLGGVTRNAVIGKVHRLKLSARAKSVSSAKRSKKPAEDLAARNRGSQQAAMRSRPAVIGNTALKLDLMAESAVVTHLFLNEELKAPPSRKLTLVQLGERTCKWPEGDPMLPDFHFCGNDSRDGSPYCAFHSKLAFQPASERRRLR